MGLSRTRSCCLPSWGQGLGCTSALPIVCLVTSGACHTVCFYQCWLLIVHIGIGSFHQVPGANTAVSLLPWGQVECGKR